TALALDEPKALAGIEPLHGTLFFIHCIYSFLSAGLRLSTTLSYLMPQVPSPSIEPRPSSSFARLAAKRSTAQKKGRKYVTLRPLFLTQRRYKSNKRKRIITRIRVNYQWFLWS
ncbi:MAG TPA: hypothetical protein VKB90_05955, partial [Candidatus Acidoferrum sp.]|nr:hypothetical protein [Candidatus Acidoferrum sp.]